MLLPLDKLTLHSYTILPPLAAQLLAHFTPLWTNYPLTITPFYLPWQPNSYIIKPPLNKLPPHSNTILPPLATQILAHVTPIGQINPSLLQNFTPLAAQLLPCFNPSGQITPSLFHHFTPLAAQLLAHFTPLWAN